jgi:hypothetical protein
MTDIKESKDLDEWLSRLYDPELIGEDELKQFELLYSYEGFNRNEVIKELRRVFPEPKEASEVIIVCAMRGPQRAAKTKLRNGRTIESYRVPASGLKGNKGLSCQRITAATADLAAFFLKRMNFPRRINSECPGWLQFPSAGSIILPDDLRQQHIDFQKKFSPMIGGTFNDQIYDQMIRNAYLNPKLKLFETVITVKPSSRKPV